MTSSVGTWFAPNLTSTEALSCRANVDTQGEEVDTGTLRESQAAKE